MNNFQLLPILSMLVFAFLGIGTAHAQDAGTVYEARYRLTGYFLRAANVCMADKKQIEDSFVLITSDEMKAFKQAFPNKTTEWMKRGAAMFNDTVMKDGMQAACDRALANLKKTNSSR